MPLVVVDAVFATLAVDTGFRFSNGAEIAAVGGCRP
jgi:hypothetical protein